MVTDDALRDQIVANNIDATSDYARLADTDVIIICVPTRLTRNREPDLRFIERTAEAIARAFQTHANIPLLQACIRSI